MRHEQLPELPRSTSPLSPDPDLGAEYSLRTFSNDLIVAAIVTIMLIPQSPTDAPQACLPAQGGLYASKDILIAKESNYD